MGCGSVGKRHKVFAVSLLYPMAVSIISISFIIHIFVIKDQNLDSLLDIVCDPFGG